MAERTDDDADVFSKPRNFMAGGFDMMSRLMWERLSKDVKLPKWQRAAMYCWAHCDRSNHCPMPKNKLQQFLACSNTRETNRVIATAVGRGWLAEGSNDRCLVATCDVKYGAGNFKSRHECEFHPV